MANRKKYFLLDTDFCIKSVKIADGTSKLIDVLMDISDCEFCCHEKTLLEISDHDDDNDTAQRWLEDQISAGKIHLYSDSKILDELGRIYGDLKYMAYCAYLKNACDAYDSSYYENHFGSLSNFAVASNEVAFLSELSACENAIGQSKSLGEKKSAVLLQMLQFLYPNQVFVFCSDDSGARRGFTGFGDIKCISILSAFVVLKDLGFSKNALEQYFVSYESLCGITNQVIFKVWNKKMNEKRKIPCREVFDGIFRNEYEVLQNGDLKFK